MIFMDIVTRPYSGAKGKPPVEGRLLGEGLLLSKAVLQQSIGNKAYCETKEHDDQSPEKRSVAGEGPYCAKDARGYAESHHKSH